MNWTDEPHYTTASLKSAVEDGGGGGGGGLLQTSTTAFFFFFFFSQQQQQHNMNMNNGLLVISGKWRAQMARHRHKVNFNINRRAYTKEEEEEEDSQEERSTCKCRSKREPHSLLSFTTTTATIIRQQSSSSAIDHWARRKCALRSELVVSWRERSKVTENTQSGGGWYEQVDPEHTMNRTDWLTGRPSQHSTHRSPVRTSVEHTSVSSSSSNSSNIHRLLRWQLSRQQWRAHKHKLTRHTQDTQTHWQASIQESSALNK